MQKGANLGSIYLWPSSTELSCTFLEIHEGKTKKKKGKAASQMHHPLLPRRNKRGVIDKGMSQFFKSMVAV